MSEMEEERKIEIPEDHDLRSRVKNVLRQIHQDVINRVAPEHLDDSATVSRLLYDILQSRQGSHLAEYRWSHEIREKLPIGSTVNLIGVRGGELIPPKEVPLRRPEVFLQMYESYITNGDVPQELINDSKEPEYIEEEDLDEMHFDDSDDEILEYFDDIRSAGTVEKLVGIKAATKFDSQVVLADAGVLKALDEKAAQMILDEITAGTPEGLQQAVAHLKKFEFLDPATTENLQTLIDASAESSETPLYPSNSVTTPWEREAANASNLSELGAIADKVLQAQERTGVDQKHSLRTIDTMAKNKFVESLENTKSLDDFKRLFAEATRFPFSIEQDQRNPDYRQDVLDIIETRAKYFLLTEIEKKSAVEEVDQLERDARGFPFRHSENITDILNEIVIRREKLGGNSIPGAIGIDEAARDAQETNDLTEKGFDKVAERIIGNDDDISQIEKDALERR